MLKRAYDAKEHIALTAWTATREEKFRNRLQHHQDITKVFTRLLAPTPRFRVVPLTLSTFLP
jgi:hypothetical protein